MTLKAVGLRPSFMAFGLTYKITRAAALMAICLQIAMPTLMANAQASGVDASRYLCAPSGQVISSDAQAAAEQIAALLGELPENKAPQTGHCDACTLGHAFALPVLAPGLTTPVTYTDAPVFAGLTIGFSYSPQAPPCRPRGPPALT